MSDSVIDLPYQPIEGCDLPALQPCVERWEMIKPWLSRKRGRMLDMGCHTGWFCRKFKDVGWEAFGVDRSREWIEQARRQDPQGTYLVQDVFDLTFSRMDVVLCLSLAMYLFDDVSRGWDLLNRVSQATPKMFMDFGGQYSNHLPFTEATVVEQVIEKTTYTTAQLLGHTAFESRPLFLFSR